MEQGQLVRSVPLPTNNVTALTGDTIYEHERIPFPSYPHEWPVEMLAAADPLP